MVRPKPVAQEAVGMAAADLRVSIVGENGEVGLAEEELVVVAAAAAMC